MRRLGGFGLLIASFVLAFLVIRYQPMVEHEIRVLGPLAYPLAIAIFAVVASAPFSVTDALAIMNGAIFGPVERHLRRRRRTGPGSDARLLGQSAGVASPRLA